MKNKILFTLIFIIFLNFVQAQSLWQEISVGTNTNPLNTYYQLDNLTFDNDGNLYLLSRYNNISVNSVTISKWNWTTWEILPMPAVSRITGL